jgi:hypothetical protein
VDAVHRAGVYACPAVDAGIRRDNPFVTGLADSVNRAGIFTCAAVDAFVGNGMCQSIHLPRVRIACKFPGKLSYPAEKVHHKADAVYSILAEKNLELSATLLYI